MMHPRPERCKYAVQQLMHSWIFVLVVERMACGYDCERFLV